MFMKKRWIGLGLGIAGIAVMGGIAYIEKKEAEENGRKYNKFKKYYQVLNKWAANTNKNITNAELLENMGFHKIAIYGNGEIGNRLAESLADTAVEVVCIIEKNANDIEMEAENGIRIVSVSDVSAYREVDAVIVTPMFDYDNIAELLYSAGTTAEILSVEDLVFSSR